ncbi:hypothetical protein GRI58_05410 [Porphyrobacter algicida]|uniref:Uncharacterized protein n=1 Tax=Qipengyuania algicida TaxID=1836209 RepID=A0A845AMN1_9SPHN|nr:hypothetical protein [Qipengyuania algicida]MXP28258.1 hypothetical protein [Qipengyuania algicida]
MRKSIRQQSGKSAFGSAIGIADVSSFGSSDLGRALISAIQTVAIFPESCRWLWSNGKAFALVDGAYAIWSMEIL